MYSVIDIKTGEIVGSYKSRKLADRKADKLDMEYGAVRYVVRFGGMRYECRQLG